MSFMSRYPTMPSNDVLAQIEGVVIIDGTVAGTPRGASTGVVACVGEFTDVTYGVSIDANGVVTTSPQAVEIEGGDFEDLVGGWDETIGEFGGDGGSGFVECKNKTFARLLCVPVNIASSQGVRLYRELPTCRSSTDPTPVVEVSAASIRAGTEFRNGNNRVRTAKTINFLGSTEYTYGIDGAVTAAGLAAAFQTFNSAGGAFTTFIRPDGKTGVKVGDILVMGVVGGAGALGANAYTMRVRSITGATAIVVEKMDGSTFDWTTGTALPWRLYNGLVADTGLETHVGTQGGYKIPARPLDATIAINLTCTPTVQADPVAPTADNWAPLTGLRLRSAPVTGLVYTAAVQAVNAVNDTALDALYATAIAALLEDNDPVNQVTTIWAARKSQSIRDRLSATVRQRYGNGRGMQAHYSPPLDVTSKTIALSNAYPGVGALRSREMAYNWPGVKTFIKEAVGFSVKLADGTYATNGQIDTTSDGWAVSVASCLPPEKNPGEESDAVQTVLAPWLSLQTGVGPGLDRGFYVRAKALGLMAPRIGRSNGGRVLNYFESGVTTSIDQAKGETEYRERRFSFYVQDTMSAIVMPFSKQELTKKLQGDVVSAVAEWLQLLKDDGRVVDFTIDAISGNNTKLKQLGIYVIKVVVEMNADLRVAVLDTRVGVGALPTTEVSFNQRAS